ncbi:DUF3224 domain-containing protein [Chromatiaceae bacterium AAb-1]|nr:DUF3224 domain-containing protein [Chromatiaceae bacterium AAb-1]
MRMIKICITSIILLVFSTHAFATETGNKMKVSGEFQVKLQPMDTYAKGSDGVSLGRMSIDKTFSGALDATSKGEMLSAMTTTRGSAGYVAIEQVTGSLSGKSGSFVLQHFGTMNRGENSLVLEVVPDSGSGDLSGLSGKMLIKIENGKHFYEFEYELTGQ